MSVICDYLSPVGMITLACDDTGLTGLWFKGQKYYGYEGTSELVTIDRSDSKSAGNIFDQTLNWLDLYFHQSIPDFLPPLTLKGSPFRTMVWNTLLTIPYGSTRTYGEIAREIEQTQHIDVVSARAVGGAVGHNPISIIIPCHRVIGANGHLTGYAGGIKRKNTLLTMEHSVLTQSTCSDT